MRLEMRWMGNVANRSLCSGDGLSGIVTRTVLCTVFGAPICAARPVIEDMAYGLIGGDATVGDRLGERAENDRKRRSCSPDDQEAAGRVRFVGLTK